jgi:hypothetical protein
LGCIMGRDGSALRERAKRRMPCAVRAIAPARGRRLERADCGIGQTLCKRSASSGEAPK